MKLTAEDEGVSSDDMCAAIYGTLYITLLIVLMLMWNG